MPGIDKYELITLLEKVKDNELILPDFQREYVWIEEEKVESFIASILAQIPIGNIITFKQNSNVFANKVIGFDESYTFDSVRKVDFLLDGQQRLTTLAMCFSDRIFNRVVRNEAPAKKLLRSNMKRRYFIILPKFNSYEYEKDFFGALNFIFKYDNPKKVTFCSDEIIDYIDMKTFNFGNDPKKTWWMAQDLDKFDATERLEYVEAAVNDSLIPLYLLVDKVELLERIVNLYSRKRYEYLTDLYDYENYEGLMDFVKGTPLETLINSHKTPQENIDDFKAELDDLRATWVSKFMDYLKACMNLSLHIVEVNDEGAARAINIYEALNKGGAKLTTFDLVIAKAASKKAPDNEDITYFQRIKRVLNEHKNNELMVILNNNEDESDWNSAEFLLSINKDRISPIIINQFLNLLCIISKFNNNGLPKDSIESLTSNYCKEKMQLELTAEEIWSYSDISIKCICEALCIMQYRMGIYNISQINYNFTLLPIAYACFLMNKKNVDTYQKSKLINRIVAWYWWAIFTGEYFSDQSVRVIEHIKLLHDWIWKDIKPKKFMNDKIDTTLNSVLNIQKYNDFSSLIFEDDISPKKAVKETLMQYVLSLNPCDFIKNDDGSVKTLKASIKGADFQAHHMIPLGSVTTIKESTKQIRSKANSELPINSPLNMALISKEANLAISSRSIIDYFDYLPTELVGNYFLSEEFKNFRFNINDEASKDKLKALLKNRYSNIKASIITTIKNNL